MTFQTRRTFLLAVGAAFAALLAAPFSPAEARQRSPKRLLLVTHTAGFRHSSIPESIKTIEKLGQQTGLWTTDLAGNAEEVQRKLTGEYLKNVDLVAFANTTGELPMSDAAKQEFLKWLRSGKGFVGMHAATDTFYKWPEFGALIGGYFDGHPWHEPVTLRVEERRFPGLKAFQASPEITDEIYQFRDWTRNDKRVLLGIDNASIDVSKGKRDDKDYAVAWAKREGKGRVFYTSLGHREEVWNDPRFQEHIIGGIRWAAGLDRTRIRLQKAAANRK